MSNGSHPPKEGKKPSPAKPTADKKSAKKAT